MTVILASGSPRRRELLLQMGLRDFQVLVPDVDESAWDGLPPRRLVETLSAQKADAVASDAPGDAIIIAADTVVALDGRILGKPIDDSDAAEMLATLSGRTHRVYTGVTARRGDVVLTHCEVTEVTFRPLTPEEIVHYIATGEPRDKAGAYGIQGRGALLVATLSGDFFTVVGLPVMALGRMLARLGLDCLAPEEEDRS